MHIEPALLELYDKINNLYKDCYEFSYDHKKDKAKKIASSYDAIRADLDKQLYAQKDADQIKSLFFLKTITEKIIFIQGSQLGYLSDV